MSRPKLVFFTSADPRSDTGAFLRAYHFANVAGSQGLEAEVRLAGPAVNVTDLDNLPDDDVGDGIGTNVRDGVGGTFKVSLSGEFRTLADIVVEVADGVSEFVYEG